MKHLMTFLLLMAWAATLQLARLLPKLLSWGGWSCRHSAKILNISSSPITLMSIGANSAIIRCFGTRIGKSPIPSMSGLIGKGKRSGAWQYDKFMSAKKQPNLKRTYQEGSVDGYIRGHLCPSNDRIRPGMNEQTFYFTNMAPQDPYLNGGLWAWLEEHVQKLALEAGEAWVVTGCIDTDSSNLVTDVTGKPIAVPEAFFKAVLLHSREDAGCGEHYEARAWVVENRSYGFSGFERKAMVLETNIDQLEEAIGLDLYPNLIRLLGARAADDLEAGYKK